jgi:gluconolactonase
VYRLSAKGALLLLLKGVKAPNGIAFSSDEKIAYVSNADKKNAVWMAYSVKEEGTFADGRVLFNATSWAKSKPGAPDGMKIDKNGNLFAAGPGGIRIIAPDGTHLGSFETGVATGNCAWANDGSSLFIAANTAILRVKLTTKGAGF